MAEDEYYFKYPPPPSHPLTYTTTRPILPLHSSRLTTTHPVNDHLTLQLRPFSPDDLTQIHSLRTQNDVMIHTAVGVVDANLAASQAWMDRYLPPNDATTLDFCIWAKDSHTGWNHIGVLGVHVFTPVPHIGYMIRTEYWGRGIATVAVRAFLDVWWSLERRSVTLNTADAKDERDLHFMRLEMGYDSVQSGTSTGPGTDGVQRQTANLAREILIAEIEHQNLASEKVIERAGFVRKGIRGPCPPPEGDVRGEYTVLDYVCEKPESMFDNVTI